MANSKLDFDSFNRFDLNECCEHFDSMDQKAWNKIRPFIVGDTEEYSQVMRNEFEFDDDYVDGAYEAFVRGVQYAMTKMNHAFEKAGVELEVQEADLGEGMGFMLVRVDDEPEDFVKRVLKKPVMMVDSWV
jgi:hypothetical protein